MRTVQSLGFGCDQAQGMRAEQQDSFCMTEASLQDVYTDTGVMAAVADGMGGQSQGGRASHLAVTTFLEQYRRKPASETVVDALRRSLREANNAVHEANRHDESGDMGTTLLACVLQGDNLYWISVGDSRLYHCRGGSIEKVNMEHSLGDEISARLRAGTITEKEAKAHAGKRHMLTSYLGLRQIPKVNLSAQPRRLEPGDQIVLCTDGLYNALSPREILTVLQAETETPDKCHGLVQAALNKMRPNQDNITALVLEYGRGVNSRWLPKRLSTTWKASIAAGVCALLALVSYAILHFTPQPESKPADTAQTVSMAQRQAPKTDLQGSQKLGAVPESAPPPAPEAKEPETQKQPQSKTGKQMTPPKTPTKTPAPTHAGQGKPPHPAPLKTVTPPVQPQQPDPKLKKTGTTDVLPAAPPPDKLQSSDPAPASADAGAKNKSTGKGGVPVVLPILDH